MSHRTPGTGCVISALPLANVDHGRLTGFSLLRHQDSGEEAPVTCTDCHRQHRFGAAWVDCVTCHSDTTPDVIVEHAERFGEQCVSCHDGYDRMLTFAHDQVFVLDGAHDTAECEDCHIDQLFAGTPCECVACHEEPDVHVGQFGLDCSRCHTVYAWTPAVLTRHVFHLDHGDEGEIACETCHVANYTEHTCYGHDCHESEQMQADHDEESKKDQVAFEKCAECHPTGMKQESEEKASW